MEKSWITYEFTVDIRHFKFQKRLSLLTQVRIKAMNSFFSSLFGNVGFKFSHSTEKWCQVKRLIYESNSF